MSIPASYGSRCGVCDEMIAEGDSITLEDDEWVHSECAEEEE